MKINDCQSIEVEGLLKYDISFSLLLRTEKRGGQRKYLRDNRDVGKDKEEINSGDIGRVVKIIRGAMKIFKDWKESTRGPEDLVGIL